MKLLRQEDGYSFYEVPKELREKIIAFPKPDKNQIVKRYGENTETLNLVKELKNGKFMYESEDGDISTLDQEMIDIYLKEATDKLLNKNFDPSKYLNESVLPVIAGQYFVTEARIDNTTWHDLNRGYTCLSFDGGLSYNNNSFISVRQYGNLGFFGFNEFGEFYNRDYNLDFNKKHAGIKTFTQAYDAFIDSLKQYKNVFKSPKSDTFFATLKGEEFALVSYIENDRVDISFGFEAKPKATNNSYYFKGESRSKTIKPTIVNESSVEELIQYAKKEIDNAFPNKESYNIKIKD